MNTSGAKTAETIDGRLSPEVKKLWNRYYPEYRPQFFAQVIESAARAPDHVLEIGAGSGVGNQKHFDLRGNVARYVGIDMDPRILSNPFLDEAHVGNAESLPFADASFDLVFHCFVAEHFESPLRCNQEIARVMKPGGRLLFLTPSRFYYPMVIARMTPHWFHQTYVRRFASGRSSVEVFPTFYRLNDGASIGRQLRECGLEYEIEHHSTPPGYLRFSRVSFLAGVLFERTVERSFPALRAQILAKGRKPAH